jgi:signal transduction histidine kinase
VYTTLFVAGGAALLAATYALAAETLRNPGSVTARPRGGDAVCRLKRLSGNALQKCEAFYRAGAKAGASDAHQILLRHLLEYSIAGLCVASVVVALVGWVVAGRLLRPLHDTTATARRLSAEDLDQRIQLGGPRDELRELADTFDEMLERLQAAFASQRRFVANAAHELRTPLAILRTEIDVTLDRSDAGPEELTAMAQVLRDVIGRSERLLDGLLVLATSEGQVPVDAPVDLARLVRASLAARSPAAAAAGLNVRRHVEAVEVRGHRELLGRLVDNLVDNAITHNVPGGWIDVRLARAGSEVVFIVASSGRTVPPEAAESVFEPFRRVTDRTGSARGAGLGLSIVRSVAAAHGGTVAGQPVEGGGLTVTVRLPAGGPIPDDRASLPVASDPAALSPLAPQPAVGAPAPDAQPLDEPAPGDSPLGSTALGQSESSQPTATG